MILVNNKNMKNKFLEKNMFFIMPILFISVLGLINIYGASFISSLYSGMFIKQALWLLIGGVLAVVVYNLGVNFFYRNATIFYILGVLALAAVLVFGTTVNGASSWFRIGPFSIQPSEIFKVFFIVFLARVINKHRGGNISLILKVSLFTAIPSILIFLEPDTGVVLMYLLISIGEILASKLDKRIILVCFITGAILIGGFFAFYFLKPDMFVDILGTSFFYRMDRLLAFKDTSSYQLNNALIGIGASGLFGFGVTNVKIYVPEVTTDFAFDLAIMNFGCLVGVLVVLAYMTILLNLYNRGKNDKKYLHRCMLSGIIVMMAFQIFEHIFMNLGLTPITGITLPFLSYGGSSIVSYAMIFGLVLKITTSNSSYS